MINLKEFLESNETVMVEKGVKYPLALAKIYNETEDMVYILKTRYNKGNNFNPYNINERCFIGIYYIEKNIFYFENRYEPQFGGLNLSNLNYSFLEDVQKELVEKVNEKIVEKINNDESKLDINMKDLELNDDSYIKKGAIAIFLQNSKVEINSYANYNIRNANDDFDIVVNYIKNNKRTVEEESLNYIEKNKNEIYKEINTNKRVLEYMKVVEQDEDYIEIRKLNRVFGSEEFKTLNIYYKQNENEMKFKIESGELLYGKNDTISSYNIKPTKDREKFQEIFKDKNGYDDIKPDYIQEITYGKKVLYKKD